MLNGPFLLVAGRSCPVAEGLRSSTFFSLRLPDMSAWATNKKALLPIHLATALLLTGYTF